MISTFHMQPGKLRERNWKPDLSKYKTVKKQNWIRKHVQPANL